MAKETTFPHPPRGHVGLLAYDSSIDKWRAVYVDADGNLQVDVAVSELPDGAATEAKQLPDGHNVAVSNMISGFATEAKQLADGHNVTVDNPSLAVTGAFYPATQPVNVESYQPVPPTLVMDYAFAIGAGTGSWFTIVSGTPDASKTWYLTDVWCSSGDISVAPDCLIDLVVGADRVYRVNHIAGAFIHLNFNTPLKVSAEVTFSLQVLQASGGTVIYSAGYSGFEV